MTTRKKRKSTRIVLAVVAVALAAYWFTRPEPPPDRGTGEYMTAVVYRAYGSPDVLAIEKTEKMLPRDNQVLIKVRAAAANPLDWHYMRGKPYVMRMGTGLRKPKQTRLGVDVAGEVVAVGKNVQRFKPGDAVFGTGGGAFAEYARASQNSIALKPANLTFEQAASVGVAGVTALQALRDQGKIQPGQKVLINGASGGVGTFAVQIAKALGADVTGVCSTRNVDMVRSLGADHVIDYTKEDFTAGEQQYDVILDNVGNRPLSSVRQVMSPKAIYVMIGGPNEGNWLGPLLGAVKASAYSPFVSQQFGMMMAEVNSDDLGFLKELMETNQVTPVIDRTYPLSKVADAIRYLEEGHAKGKVVVTVARIN
jgi:NADPH:quinone reductase-like Zn-dependent oxidoreductase